MKLQRIFMTVRRGITDGTAVCVFPWEKPLLEEVHKGQAIEVSIDQLCSKEGVKEVKKIKLHERINLDGEPAVPTPGLDQREQLEAQRTVSPDDSPLSDPESEYGRMEQKYGMHPDLPLTVVEKVYGNARQFRQCMREFAAGRVPAFLDDGAIEDVADEKQIAEMSMDELKQACRQRDIAFKGNASRETLEGLLLETA